MAVKPRIETLNASSIDILNVIRANASSVYQERIPQATRDNIRDVGNAMMTYQSTQNEFLSALVNRIGRVIITSKMYSNPLKEFKKGMLEYGETVEEIFVNIAKAHQYDPATAENEVFKREIPDVQAVFHRLNYQNFYKATISNDQLRQAFLSINGITDLIAKIVDSMYTGAEFDEFTIMKNLIYDAGVKGELYPVTIPAVSAENAKTIVSKIKGISNSLEFMSDKYNAMGVKTFSKKNEQILLLNAEFDAVIDVEVLASAFNMDKAQFMGQRVLVDDFGGLENVVAVLVDKDWFMVFDNFMNFTEQYNGEGLYWNYWYHVWKTFSVSPFANAICFVTGTPSVTSVTVSPSTLTVAKAQSGQLSAEVVVENYAPKTVTWALSGTETVTSTIDSNGKITIAADEANTTITVTATSTFDSAKTGTATVTVQA